MCISTRFQLHKIAMIRLLTLSPVFAATLYGAVDSQQAGTALASHNRAIHLLDDWMRDPYIVLAPDGWFYLTCTRRSNIDGGKQGIQVWRSRGLVKWESLGALWTVECTSQDIGNRSLPGHG